MDTLIVSYIYVLYSVTCTKTCHFTASFTSQWTSISFPIFILHVFTVLLIFVNIYHFTYTFSHAHAEAHTCKHTCMISTQEESRQPGTKAWLGGAEERLLLETKALHKQKTNVSKPRSQSRKRFEHIELPAKLLDYFLRSNKSNVNQKTVVYVKLGGDIDGISVVAWPPGAHAAQYQGLRARNGRCQ